MADEIAERFGERPELIKGKDGVFEIALDGKNLYSKRSTGRFPEPGEVERALSTHLSA